MRTPRQIFQLILDRKFRPMDDADYMGFQGASESALIFEDEDTSETYVVDWDAGLHVEVYTDEQTYFVNLVTDKITTLGGGS